MASSICGDPFSCALAVSGVSAEQFAVTASIMLSLVTYPDSWPRDVAPDLEGGERFEFVVVGAGSAGAALAARLAAAGRHVLLVEAGGDPTLGTEIPMMGYANCGTQTTWNFETEPDGVSCYGMRNQRCRWPKGRVLGGSSSVNILYYVRGHPKDFDDWKMPGWFAEDVFPYFLKLESYKNFAEAPGHYKSYYNTDGPMSVERFNATDWGQILTSAYTEIGLRRLYDYNGPTQLGVSRVTGTINEGRRESTARAYLLSSEVQENLNVLKHARATKVVIDPETKEAKGINVILQNGRKLFISASKEVILSAGSINTPQLLMLSGIGHKLHLKSFNIDIIADLPVGDNLEDHLVTPIYFSVEDFNTPALELSTYVDSMRQYLDSRTGSFSSLADPSVVTGFINTLGDSDRPDIQFVTLGLNRNDTFAMNAYQRGTVGYDDFILDQIRELNERRYMIAINVVLLKPKSKGRIRLRSANPSDNPRIFTGYLSEDADVRTFFRGIKRLEKMQNTEAFKSRGVRIVRFQLPSCEGLTYGSYKYWRCYMQYMATTLHHPHGTVGMGRVVDERLKVYGVNGLRVADGSIMPSITSGNTNAPCIMIGERAAGILAEDYDFELADNDT